MADENSLLEDHPLLLEIDPEQHIKVDLGNIPPPKISEEDTSKEVKTLAGKNREATKVRQEQKPKSQSTPKKESEFGAIAMPDFEEEELQDFQGSDDETQDFDYQAEGNIGFDDEDNLFIDTFLGLIANFLPMLIGNWAKIDEYQILKAEKEEIVPIGSFERVDAINSRNQAAIAKTVQAGTSQIRKPLIATMNKRQVNPGPESALLMGVGAMGYSLFSVTREIRQSNKAFIAELVDIQKEKKSKEPKDTKKEPKTEK
ncbi:hypothetical protein BKI52_33050 [marine bacterium AO1-C]|nr:hypothetical protein BKI52_33050 [marine bacterium AO1-C]